MVFMPRAGVILQNPRVISTNEMPDFYVNKTRLRLPEGALVTAHAGRTTKTGMRLSMGKRMPEWHSGVRRLASYYLRLIHTLLTSV